MGAGICPSMNFLFDDLAETWLNVKLWCGALIYIYIKVTVNQNVDKSYCPFKFEMVVVCLMINSTRFLGLSLNLV